MNEPEGVDRVYELGRSFQEAWPADIDDFLRDAGPSRREAVVLLCNIDLELRWRSDRQGRAEDYFRRFPAEWAEVPDEALELIASEYGFRRDHARLHAFCLDYGVRYAALIDHLRDRFSDSHSTSRYSDLKFFRRGGPGEVFVAHDEQVGRRVALKRIGEDYRDDPRSRDQFVFEAEITGRLEHPGIVPVYSIEREADGQVYYAMRLITPESGENSQKVPEGGETLHEAIQARRGEPSCHQREWLGRLAFVCKTISYAHDRGILHLDLKPANILLGKYGETLVVDWGLARPFGVRPAGGEPPPPPARPDGSCIGGTPGYGSPEQLANRHDQIGPASDVYGLGATLYCILTGKHPRAEGLAPHGPLWSRLYRNLVTGVLTTRDQDDPTTAEGLPATRVVPPRQLDPSIHPALEAICLKAMAPRPEDRYPDPAELAAEIERWLADEPVRSWPDPWWTRSRRWLSRHRTAATAAVAALLVAVVGLGIVLGRERAHGRELFATNQQLTEQKQALSETNKKLVEQTNRTSTARDLANDRFHVAIEAVRSFHTQVSDDVMLKQPELKELREKLLGSARLFYKKLDKFPDPEGSTLSRYELFRCYFEIARLTGAVGTAADTEAAYRQAIASALSFLAELPARNQDAVKCRAYLAECRINLGNCLRATGRNDEALRSFLEAKAILDVLIRDDRKNVKYRSDLSQSLLSLSELQRTTGQPGEAEQNLREAQELLERLTGEVPDEPEYRAELATVLIVRARSEGDSGRFVESVKSFQEAQALLEGVVREQPNVAEYRVELAKCFNSLGIQQLRIGRHEEAGRSYQEALRQREKLVLEHPTVTEYRDQLATSYLNFANWLNGIGRIIEGIQYLQKARELRKELVANHPAVERYSANLALVHNNLGIHQFQSKLKDDALQSFRDAIQLYEVLSNKNPQDGKRQADLARSYSNLGAILHEEFQKNDEALANHRRALDIRQKLADENPKVVSYRADLAESHFCVGNVLRKTDRLKEAIGEYRSSKDIQEAIARQNSENFNNQSKLGRTLDLLGRCQASLGDWAAACEAFQQATVAQRKAFEKMPKVLDCRSMLSDHYQHLAEALREMGKPVESAESSRERRKLWPNDPARLSQVAGEIARCIPLVGRGDDKLKADQEAERRRYADEAMETLRQAADVGLKDFAYLEKSADLDPLRSRDDFRALLRTIQGRVPLVGLPEGISGPPAPR